MLAQFIVPLPFSPVPVSLATLSVFLAGGLLRPVNGALSQLIYILLGAVGLPVFARFSGGIGILAGPTGGYLIGYVLAAFIIALLRDRLPNKTSIIAAVLIVGMFVYYVTGTAWFMFSTNTGLVASLSKCVLPFIPGDIMKVLLATVLIRRLEVHMRVLTAQR